MLFKVMYQDSKDEVPVREHTKSLFIEAESNREVRKKLTDRSINIEYIQPIEGAHLEYEKQSEDFAVENV